MLGHYGLLREKMNSQHGTQPTPHDWIGLYKNPEDELPEWVASAGNFKNFELGPVQFNTDFMDTFFTMLIHRLNQMQEMQTHPQLSHVKCHMLGWTNYHEVVLIPNSPCSLGH